MFAWEMWGHKISSIINFGQWYMESATNLIVYKVLAKMKEKVEIFYNFVHIIW